MDEDQEFMCPRRVQVGGPFVDIGPDGWLSRGAILYCGYCGSLHPDLFMDAASGGVELLPTDKSYKIYVGPDHAKFYFQHLDATQRGTFVDLMNEGTLNICFPGRFYVDPFFVRRTAN